MEKKTLSTALGFELRSFDCRSTPIERPGFESQRSRKRLFSTERFQILYIYQLKFVFLSKSILVYSTDYKNCSNKLLLISIRILGLITTIVSRKVTNYVMRLEKKIIFSTSGSKSAFFSPLLIK